MGVLTSIDGPNRSHLLFVHTSLVLMLSLERLNLEGWRLALNFYIRRLSGSFL
jgi:hypothetical protein